MGLGKMQILKNAKSAASAKMAQVSKAVKPKKADEDSKSKADEFTMNKRLNCRVVIMTIQSWHLISVPRTSRP